MTGVIAKQSACVGTKMSKEAKNKMSTNQLPTETKGTFSSFTSAFKIHYATFIGLYGGWVFDAMDATIYAYAVPGIIQELKISFAEAFSVVSIFFLCAAIGGVFMGSICDKIGRKSTVLLSVGLYGIFNFMCGTAHSLNELYLYRALVGFSLGGLWPAMMSLIAEIWPAKSRGTAIGLMQGGWSVGMFCSAAFAYFLIPAFGWRGMFYATAVPSIIAFSSILFFVKESPVWLESKRINKQITDTGGSVTNPLLLLFNKRNLRTVILGLGISAFGQFGWWALFTFLPTYMDRTLGLGITKGAEFMLWVSIGAYAGYIMFGYWADVYGRRVMFAAFTTAMAIMIPIFIWTVSNGGTAYLPIVAIVLGFSTGYYGGYGSLYSEQFSTDVRATASSFCLNMGRLANFAGPLLIPWLIPRVGFGMAMGVASLALVLAAIVVMQLKETKGKEITARD